MAEGDPPSFGGCRFQGLACFQIRQVEAQDLALGQGFVVRRVGQDQGQDAEVDQVGLVDAGEGLGQDDAHTEVARGQGRVFAAGALAVVVAAQDEALAGGLGAGLLFFTPAKLRPGVEIVLEAVKFA